jgi:GT2 family glycosyltransferase
MNEPVSIIILNYNGKQFLQNCFHSVLNQSYQNFEIIFFDNNSADGSVEFVKENLKNEKITIVKSDKNIGFAGGNNEATKRAKNDLVVLLNNDTSCDKDWLKYLVEAVKEKNTVASSFVVTEGVNPKYYESNGSISFGMYNVMNIFDNIEDEFYPNGCSLIFRKSEIGVPFDSDYFYYSEDLYLGLKARFLGMKVKFIKESVVHHFGGGASTANMMKTFYQERNRWFNLYTFFGPWFIIRLLPVISVVKTAKLFQAIFSNRYSFTGVLKAYLWFYFHIPTIVKKRKALRQFKKVPEKEVIKFMTSKLLNEESTLSKIINSFTYFYSRMFGIKTIEYYKSAESQLP